MSHQPSPQNLLSGFLESAERYASRPALLVNAETFSYAELRRLAANIASTIASLEVGASPFVALLAERTVNAYAGILGILGAGKAYVPLNPKFPIERTRSMLYLSHAELLIVGRECVDLVPQLLHGFRSPLTVIFVGASVPGNLAADFPEHRFVESAAKTDLTDFPASLETSPNSFAYLLFTSGSTGQPKGIVIRHSNVNAYVRYVADCYGVTEHDRFSQEFDLTFDLSVHDMFVCWSRGACLCTVPEKSVMAPIKFIRDRELTFWFSVPSVINFATRLKLLRPGSCPSLRVSLFCGEPLTDTHARFWQEAAPNSILENLYGPTETTIAITHYRWNPETSPAQCLNGIVPIGLTFPEQEACIIDSLRMPVANGEIGELCLAGSQVASGYLDDPAKTARQFVRFPWSGETVWYRTGDLARRHDSGLHYAGRFDQQVKIRGHRVELQEIEAVLREACGTEQVVAVPQCDSQGYADAIIAFACANASPSEQRVLAACTERLPAYMVPRKIYFQDALPLNSNGKIDRRKLQSSIERRFR
jgi:amino acid adenylation domain-containing protein